ncbi:msr0510 [Mesorhizobium japonicum MAFF 303099]|uniref:Msr0510 protein n=1 Tax=Mesorhizobium japonicum (strain LMG 29417 / CECT 9101 / MAFF 303099) TaxID=266835 RepID=Q98MN0_RHILO|nr:msr0510 [Mesorhizobium japonicum MAFF 303099]
MAGHDTRMSRIAALINPHELTYMLLDWQVWWPASHRKPETDLGASGNSANTDCRNRSGGADRGAGFRRCRLPGDAGRA